MCIYICIDLYVFMYSNFSLHAHRCEKIKYFNDNNQMSTLFSLLTITYNKVLIITIYTHIHIYIFFIHPRNVKDACVNNRMLLHF